MKSVFLICFVLKVSVIAAVTEDDVAAAAPPQVGALWEGRQISSEWTHWMANRIEDRCGFSKDSDHDEDYSKVTNVGYHGARSLKWLGSNPLQSSLEKYDFNNGHQSYTTALKRYVKQPLLPYFYIAIFVVSLIILLFILPLHTPKYRQGCSRLWCRLCCVSNDERDSLRRQTKGVHCAWWIGSALLLMILPIILCVLLISYTTDFETDANLLSCNAYRFPHSLLTGVHFDQQRFVEKRALSDPGGRELGEKTIDPWVGVTGVLDLIDEAKSEAGTSKQDGSVANKAMRVISEEAASLIERSDAAEKTLMQLLASLKDSGEALASDATTAPYKQMCILCTLVEKGAYDSRMQEYLALLTKQREYVDHFVKNITTVFDDNPRFDDVRKSADDVAHKIMRAGERIAKIYNPISDYEPTVKHWILIFVYTGAAVIAVTLLCVIAFSVTTMFLYSKATSRELPGRLRRLRIVSTIQWSALAVSVVVFLAFASVFLTAAYAPGQACNIVDTTLLQKNQYDAFPYLVEYTQDGLGLKSKQETLNVLGDVLSYGGSGSLEGILDLKAMRKTADDALANAHENMELYSKVANDEVDSMNLTQLQTEFEVLGSIVSIDFIAAISDDPLELQTYPEVLTSGVQKDKIVLTQALINLLAKLVPPDIPVAELLKGGSITGINDLQVFINDILEKKVRMSGPQFHNWCFSAYNDCSSSASGVPYGKVIVGDSGSDMDKTVDEIVESLLLKGEVVEAERFKNAIQWISRKHGFLKTKSFVDPSSQKLTYSDYGRKVFDSLLDSCTIDLDKSLRTRIASLSQRLRELVDDSLTGLINHITTAANSKSLLVEALTVLDPVCKGAVGDLAAMGFVWSVFALVNLCASVLVFKLWRHCTDRLRILHSHDGDSSTKGHMGRLDMRRGSSKSTALSIEDDFYN